MLQPFTPSSPSLHPQPRPFPSDTRIFGEPYHFCDHPLRALTLEEALQDAKTLSKDCRDDGGQGHPQVSAIIVVCRPSLRAIALLQAIVALTLIETTFQRWRDIQSSTRFIENAELHDSAMARECDGLVAKIEQCDGFQTMRKYEITALHYNMALAIKRLSEAKQREGRSLHDYKWRRVLWTVIENWRLRKAIGVPYYKLEKLVGKLEIELLILSTRERVRAEVEAAFLQHLQQEQEALMWQSFRGVSSRASGVDAQREVEGEESDA